MNPFKITQIFLILGTFVLAGCAETQFLISSTKRLQDGSGALSGVYKVGTPYQIQGTWYYPAEEWDYDESGIASWYGPNFHGKQTANGETYDMNDLTAAHRTLPLPSWVKVINLENGRALELRVNDRGPFAKGRIIDISRRGAQLLGFKDKGTARVRVQLLAERSQELKAALLGEQTIAKEGSPINVARLPKASVSSASLPPPPGATQAPGRTIVNNQPAPSPTDTNVVQASVIDPQLPATPGSLNPTPADSVTSEPVSPTEIFVQAGAFTNYQNALRTKLSVSRYVPADISHVVVNKRDFYRVRVGPLPSVEAADTALEQVQAAGYPGASVIVTETPRGG